MSHFTTYVITKTDNREELDKLMLPYHEYECTGITDYCVHVDVSEEALLSPLSRKDSKRKLQGIS